MDLGDPLARAEMGHREAAERHHDGGVQDLELALQVRQAGSDLVRLRVAVARRPALDDVRDEDLLAPPAERREQLYEQLARATHERPTLLVLGLAGAFADEQDLRVRAALAGHGPGSRFCEAAARANPHLGGDHLEGRSSFLGRQLDRREAGGRFGGR